MTPNRIILLVSLSFNMLILNGQDLDYLNNDNYYTILNGAYGSYERNSFDIIIPKKDVEHGLVIFIHGGGFQHGDKKALYKRKQDIKTFLENNIAVATINYRFYKNNDSLGVKVSLQDIKRAIQYFRFNASKFNIDKERVGCYGGSAGAGSSLYFAYHDDLAIQGDTTLLGESTRLKCVGAIATQATYNVFKWKKIIPFMSLLVPLKRKQFYDAAANFYGYPKYKPFKKQVRKASESLDMLTMIDSEDPPTYLMNLMEANFPKNNNIIQHHRKHAVAVSRKLDKANVINYVYTSKNAESEKTIDFKISDFMVKFLKE
ncbi:Carboxylesterase family protein [Hyunsoonleella jejuensis]|uniref:Carboxylesterase family protein n=1 Tax=Hyunsoonleella jejuensis TaxID=419940 RepID=A0A1H9CDU9_9FLAO|nr:alpha/beta hydrolase [Hyunsoonleella jejuensis]SEP99410.1 Carboxylesterase family protein [Hyunsoonleella jejuensis]